MAQQEERELTDAFKNIGKLLSQNMGIGIAEGTESARSAMDQLTGELLESQQNYFKEKTELEQAIEDATEAQCVREYQMRLRQAKTAAQAQRVRQNEIRRLQKKANQEYIDALKEHLKTVEEQIRQQKDRIVNEFNEIANQATDSLEVIDQAIQNMQDKMVNYGGLFEKKQEIFLNSGPGRTKEVFEKTILDLSDERRELEQYAELLHQVGEMEEIPDQLFNKIKELSIPDAIRYQKALLALPETEREKYLEDWNAIQDLAKETAQTSYAKDIKQTLDTVETELAKWYGTIPEGFLREGELSAEQFGSGFMNKLEQLQNVLQNAVTAVLSVPVTVASNEAAGGTQTLQQTQNNTYILKDTGQTIAQQLQAIDAAETVKRLRGAS